ncbi:hypothetical protein GWK47_038514 [Chionoecetes opilio]|uniref:Uncharacterized protein n=1 Tax=Chionoecetes opilio TaxID=41210 RepID=A0A8J5D1U6_CHIOP|nr:hypothetical protein GWK47_038514 [Chionoecetes opilio]
MAAATAHVHAQPAEVCFFGQPEPNPCWVNSFPERASATGASSTSSVCRQEVGEISGLPRQPRSGGGGGRQHDPHSEKSRLCGEDPPAVRIMAELGSVQEASAEVDVGESPEFSHWQLMSFSTSGSGRFDLLTVDDDRHVPAAALPRMDHVASCSVHRLPRAGSSAWVAGDEEETVVTTTEADFVPSAASPLNRPVPPSAPHADHDAGFVAAALDRTRIQFGPTAVPLFTRLSTRRRHSRSQQPCGCHRRSARRRWLGIKA